LRSEETTPAGVTGLKILNPIGNANGTFEGVSRKIYTAFDADGSCSNPLYSH
jgi:hypothetical protein